MKTPPTLEHQITAVGQVIVAVETHARRAKRKGPLLNAIHRPHALDTNDKLCNKRCHVTQEYEDARHADFDRYLQSLETIRQGYADKLSELQRRLRIESAARDD